MSISGPTSLLPKPSQLTAYGQANWQYVRLHHWSETKTLPPNAKGEVKVMKLGKAPIGKKWTLNGVDLEKAVAHANMGKNVGALIPKGWAVLDIDPRNFPKGRKVWNEFCTAMGIDETELPLVVTGSKGRHYFVRIPEDFKGSVGHPDYPGVEFKQNGAQVVTAGSIHPDTQGYYMWAEGRPAMEDAPMAPDTVLELFKIKAPTLGGARGSGSWNSLTLEQIDEALAALDATKFRDQDEWFGLMCSVHWLSGGEGRENWIEWSTSDPSYEDHREIIEMRWDSLGRDNDSNALVAKGGLLFKALKAEGISPGDAKWKLDPDKDFEDYDEAEAETDAANLKLVHEAITDKIQKTAGSLLEAMNNRHFVLWHKAKVVIGSIVKEEDDNGAEITVYNFTDKTSFGTFYANKTIKGPDGPLPVSDWWLHHPGRLTYNGMEFRPDRTPGAYINPQNEKILNQWTGWALKPKKGDWSLFKDLIDKTICGEDPAKIEYIYKWFAKAYQKPDGPIGTAMAINGLKGTGKTTVWEVFSAPFGSSHAMATSRMSEVFGDFNGRMMGKMALLIEEALFAASKTSNAILKDTITGGKVSINEKFLPAYSQKNFLRILIFTNNDHIVEATEDERRFFVTRALTNRKYDPGFWKALRKQMFEEDGVAAFFHDMLEMDITGFDAFHDMPRTKELLEQINITRGATLDWLAEKFDSGEDQFGYAWKNAKQEFILPIHEMWMDFAMWQKNQSHARYDNPIKSQSGFSRELKRVFDELALTTASVPAEFAAFEIKSHEQVVNNKTYQIAKVYRFHSYAEFEGTFRKRYGLEMPDYDPSHDEADDEPDFGTEDEWDII
jgi:hypothetical protein